MVMKTLKKLILWNNVYLTSESKFLIYYGGSERYVTEGFYNVERVK